LRAQTVYTVGAFHAESTETGQDVRVLRPGAIAALPLVLCVPVLIAQPSRDPSHTESENLRPGPDSHLPYHAFPRT
jgi:hypothetical protein